MSKSDQDSKHETSSGLEREDDRNIEMDHCSFPVSDAGIDKKDNRTPDFYIKLNESKESKQSKDQSMEMRKVYASMSLAEKQREMHKKHLQAMQSQANRTKV